MWRLTAGVRAETSNNEYVVDLNRWEIQQGSFGKPPYTLQEWEIAYKNLLGFNAALQYANTNGYNYITVPKGNYSFCYVNTNALATNYGQVVGISLKPFSNQTIDLNGSTFEVMYDSINRNPYDQSTSMRVWELRGKLFDLKECHNTRIINGNIIGDVVNRSFTDGGTAMYQSEKGMDNTYGIGVSQGSDRCSFKDLDISMFMADAIIVENTPTNTGNFCLNWLNGTNGPDSTTSAGYVDNTGAVIAQTGSYVSPKYPVLPEHKKLQLRTYPGLQGTKLLLTSRRYFEFVFLNSSNALISRKKATFLQTVTVPYGSASVRIQFFNETSTTITSIKFAITKPQTHHITIENCEIHDNHRGGISGGADFTHIYKCEIYNNGMDCGIGIPLMPEDTRYQVNFEDSYCNYVHIEKNHIHSGFFGLLLAAHHIDISDNYFSNFGYMTLQIHNNFNTFIDKNTFYNGDLLWLSTMDTSTMNRTISFSNNTVSTSAISDLVPSGKSYVKYLNNTFFTDLFNISPTNTYSSGNDIHSFSGA